MGFDYPTDTKLHLRGAKEINMDTHFMRIDEFKKMNASVKEAILTSLMDAYSEREYVSIRVDDRNQNMVDVTTMLSGETQNYYDAGGIWTYSNPFTILKELLE